MVFLAVLALYVLTVAPTVYNLDSAELTTAAATGGLLRSPGYPLYLLIGRPWSLLPIGDVGFRMNLLSAVCGAATVALAYRLLRRIGTGAWPALAGVGLLAVSHYFWAMSSIAEVYTLHTAFVAALLLALVVYGERPTPRRLGVATLITGLSFAHHVATVLLAPGCVLFVLMTAGRRALAPRSLAWAGGGLLAGLSVYLYLPLLYLQRPTFNYAGRIGADGAFVPVDLTTLRGLWWLISGRPFADQMLAVDRVSLGAELAGLGAELWRVSLGVGLGAGVLGLIVGLRHRRPFTVAVLAMFVAHGAFYLSYDVVDKATMFLPNQLLWVLLVALGYEALEGWLASHGGSPLSRPRTTPSAPPGPAVVVLRAVALGAVLVGGVWNHRLVDLSRDGSARERGEAILRQLPPDALLIGWWNTVPVVQYLQLVEGRRPDVVAVNRFLVERGALRPLIERHLERRPVYSDQPLVRDATSLLSRSEGLLYRLEPRPDPKTGSRPAAASRPAGSAAVGPVCD